MNEPVYWQVAIEAPLPQSLTYKIPPEILATVEFQRGRSCLVPLGKRQVLGVLLAPTKDIGTFKLRDLISLDLTRPLLHEKFLQWIEWLAQYYVHPVGLVTEMAFAPLPRSLKERKSRKAPVAPEISASLRPTLTQEQMTTIKGVQAHPGFGVHLIHGVTGSGKTEIYMQLLEKIISEGKQGIVLVPEISLTPQLIQRFSGRLGNAVAVIHSHLTPREKTNQWWEMVEGRRQVLIGARSALFCPLPQLGMIVIDEEHEASFKQDEKLKYHARDAGVMLGKFLNIPVVLGSATPSLETWSNAQSGRYHLHELKNRVEDRAMPTIEVVDLREEREQRKLNDRPSDEMPFWMSQRLHLGLNENYSRKQQSALFLNRRGMAQSVLCPSCGFVPECPNCAVSLTLHGRNHLLCHYCDFHQTLLDTCTECKEGEPRPVGLGTETIETDLQKLFPSARIVRMDRDEISSREDLERTISEIERGEADFIVGTQMIAKGLDFQGLTLVGLVMADIAFNLPDFRASERAFQLLTQVSGRSGRHLSEGSGQVIIQTYNPDHPSIQFTQAHDYRGFATMELGFREALGYPPFGRLAIFRIQGIDQEKVKKASALLKSRAHKLQKQAVYAKVEVLGPAQAPMAKLRNKFRHQLFLKAPDAATLGRFCRTVCGDSEWVPPAVSVTIDIDAVNML